MGEFIGKVMRFPVHPNQTIHKFYFPRGSKVLCVKHLPDGVHVFVQVPEPFVCAMTGHPTSVIEDEIRLFRWVKTGETIDESWHYVDSLEVAHSNAEWEFLHLYTERGFR